MRKEVESWEPGFKGNVPVSKSQAVSLVYHSVSPFKTQNNSPPSPTRLAWSGDVRDTLFYVLGIQQRSDNISTLQRPAF